MEQSSFDERDKKGAIIIQNIVAWGIWECNLYVFCTRPIDFIFRACSQRLRFFILNSLLLMVVWIAGVHTASAQKVSCDPSCERCGDPTGEALGSWINCMHACAKAPPCDYGAKDRSKGSGLGMREASKPSDKKAPNDEDPPSAPPGAGSIPAPTNCANAEISYLDAVVNRRVNSDTVYVNVDDPLLFAANYESYCAPNFLWEIKGHTRSNEPTFTHSFRESGEYKVEVTAFCIEECGKFVDHLQVVAMSGRFISDDPARAQIHITRQKPVVAAAFFVEPASQLGEFIITPKRDVNIRNQRHSAGKKSFDVSKSNCNNEYGSIVAIHKRDPAVRFEATVVDGRVQVMNEDGRTFPKSAHEADRALKALTQRLDVLRGEPLGAITAGTLDQLGYEKAFEVGALVSTAAGFLPGPRMQRDISRRQHQNSRQQGEIWSRRRGPVEEIGCPPRRAGDYDPDMNFLDERVFVSPSPSGPLGTRNPTYPREQLTLPGNR